MPSRSVKPPKPEDLSKQLDNWVSVLNEQINRLMTEINRRSTTQQTLAVANLTAATALSAAAVSGKASVLVLLALPLISVCLGSQYKDHHQAIGGIALYVRECVERNLREVLERRLPSNFVYWQEFHHWRRSGALTLVAGQPTPWRKTWWSAVVVNFHGTSCVALGLTCNKALLEPLRDWSQGQPVTGAQMATAIGWVLLLFTTAVSAASMMKALRHIWDRVDYTASADPSREHQLPNTRRWVKAALWFLLLRTAGRRTTGSSTPPGQRQHSGSAEAKSV